MSNIIHKFNRWSNNHNIDHAFIIDYKYIYDNATDIESIINKSLRENYYISNDANQMRITKQKPCEPETNSESCSDSDEYEEENSRCVIIDIMIGVFFILIVLLFVIFIFMLMETLCNVRITFN